MKSQRITNLSWLFAAASMLTLGASALAADTTSTVPVTMTVTANVAANKRMPEISPDDVVVRQGKTRLEVTEWVPARGSRAGLELFILIDDSADSRIALHYDELRAFINAQPSSTSIGIGYMRNASVQIAQQLTVDRNLAGQALRVPFGYAGSYSSPYLSVINLMKRWPADGNRREVILFTDGVGRDRHRGLRAGYRLDMDADSAIAIAQKTGTNLFTIYAPGSARAWHGRWEALNGQTNMTRLSDETGGASFYLGLHGSVSIQPYLAQVQTMLDNQYLLSFSAVPDKKSGLRTIDLSTAVAGVDLTAHNAVWIASGK